MSTRTKLVILELVAGLFGWSAIIAGGFSIYYLFSSDPWSSFFWAVGIAIVASWLQRGLEDNKTRVAYMADLEAQGKTPEEAGEIWFQKYNEGNVGASTAQTLTPSSAREAVADFGDVLERHAGDTVVDVSKLPLPKEDLKRAYKMIISLERNEATREVLKAGYVQLAMFQEGVGDARVSMEVNPEDFNTDDPEAMSANLDALTDSLGAATEWSEKVLAEQGVLLAEIE